MWICLKVSLDAEVELSEVDAHGDNIVAGLLVHVLQIHLHKEMLLGFHKNRYCKNTNSRVTRFCQVILISKLCSFHLSEW